MTLLVRKRQLAAKIEVTEGVAESLSASDAGLLVNQVPKANFDPELYQRNPARLSLTRLTRLTGKRPGGMEFGLELRGSGSLTTEPKWSPLIKACGFQVNPLVKITIGAVTAGPFLHGETITGSLSAATGRVVVETVDGTTTLYFVSLTGTFQDAETLTGATSGASATSGSAPSAAGFEGKLASTSVPSLTLGLYEDGVRKLLRGARGSVKFSFKLGEPAQLEFNFMGVEAGVTDTPLLTGVAFDTPLPPVLLNAVLSSDGVSLNVGELEIDLANTLVAKDKIGDPQGILSYLITERGAQGSFNPEMVPVATHDFHTKWFNNTPMILDLSYGTADGNTFRVYAPKIVYSKVDDADRDGLQLAQTTFDVTGSLDPGDDELTLLLL